MLINADFSQAVILPADEQEWIHSPAAGVDRIMLDRIGVEVARATSIVRYASGSEFSRHEHARGEEFYVLEGIFADEHGHYPAGTYVRNPPGSGHSPFSKNGCRIFVKLRQFDPADLSPVVIDTNKAACWLSDGAGPVARMSLHEFGTEVVQMLRLQEGADFSQVVGEGGFEILIVSGSIDYTNKRLGAGSWLRLPAGSNMRLRAVGNTTLWIKSGHLPNE